MGASVKLSEQEMRRIYEEARAAGDAAGKAHGAQPMRVVERANPLGDVLGVSDEDNPIVRDYGVYSDGVCGFAWVNVSPGTSRFARWLVKNGYGRSDSYYGGVTIWISGHRQSYEKKLADAQALASVLQAAGIKAYASGRLD